MLFFLPASIVIIDLVVLQCSFFAATVGCTIIFGSGLTHVSLFLVTSVLVTCTHQRHTCMVALITLPHSALFEGSPFELLSAVGLRVHLWCALMLDRFGNTLPVSALFERQHFELLSITPERLGTVLPSFALLYSCPFEVFLPNILSLLFGLENTCVIITHELRCHIMRLVKLGKHNPVGHTALGSSNLLFNCCVFFCRCRDSPLHHLTCVFHRTLELHIFIFCLLFIVFF